MKAFGSRSQFSIEIGNFISGSPDLCEVDVYAADQHLTPVDNVVYLPTFLGALDFDLNWLMSDFMPELEALPFPNLSPTDNYIEMFRISEEDNTLYLKHRFMDWGETCGDVSIQIFRIEGIVHLPFSFYEKSDVYCACIRNSDLNVIIHKSIVELMWRWMRHKNGT